MKIDLDFEKDLVAFIIGSVSKASDAKERMAAMSGAAGDGGASRMRDKLKYWTAGLRNEVPDEYQGIVRQFEKELDPEYAQYLKLKKKFEEE